MLELALEGIAHYHEIKDRHEDNRYQRDRIAHQLLEIAAHDGEELQPEHRRPPQRCCGIPAPTSKLTFLAGSSRSGRPGKGMKTASSESFCTGVEVTRSPAPSTASKIFGLACAPSSAA